MKRKLISCLLLIAAAIVIILNKNPEKVQTDDLFPIHIAGDNNYPPYEYVDENGTYKGFNVDIMNAISIELGIDIDIVPMEWHDAVEALERKEIDLIQGMSRTEERKGKFLFANPIVVNSQAIFVMKDTSIIAEIEDLSGVRVAFQEGDINQEIINNIQDVILIPKKNQKEAIEALLNGEADACICNRLTSIYYLQKLKKAHLVKIVGEPIEGTEYGPATYQGNENLILLINQGLRKIKSNGTYDKIYKKWFGEELTYNKNDIIKSYIKEFSIIVSIIAVVILLFIIWNKKLRIEVDKRTRELRLANEDLIMHQKKIHNLAYYDSVTSLPNKLFITEALVKAIKNAEEGNNRFALLYFDLDRFKQINDTLGHDFGDVVLEQIGKRIERLIRETDIIARIGGDEFLILMKDIKSEDDPVALANKIIEDFKNSFIVSTYDLFLSTSIGIAVYPEAGKTVQALMKNADIAMYKAKNSGGNSYYIYTRELSEKEMDNLILINELRVAEKNNELRLFYQPIVDIKTGDVVGMESLIRWENPREGIISPARFIPLAEETGLIVSIGEWVLRTACLQQKAWVDKGYKPINVSVNISARQFQQPNFAETVLRIIKETGIDPNYLVLEITESIAIINVGYTLEILKKLKAFGICVAIDDFGTGYSSLYKLKEMNIDGLKIDRSFIRDIRINEKNEKIIKAIIALASELNLWLTAEGVETSEQIEFLKENRCNKAQGFYYSRPIPPEEFEKVFLKQ